MLGVAVLIGLVHLLAAALAGVSQRGLKWSAGPRDEPVPVSGLAARLERAFANYRESFPFFAAAAIAVVVAGRGNDTTALAAQAYFWARVVYLPLYAAGVPYVRSLVWLVSLLSILALVFALL